MSTDCIFCKIAQGDIPVELAYKDDQVMAFRDIAPQAPHHLLIVPLEHIPTTLDLEEKHRTLVGHIYLVAAKLARELGIAEDGFRVVNNCNEAAGQTVWHLHFHLLGGRDLSWPPG